MGLFGGLFNRAEEINIEEIREEYAPLLTINEQIEQAYQIIRDMFIFTNKRLIMIDKQGLTGKKVNYHSIPYKSITHFSVETVGNFDLDGELLIWVSGMGEVPYIQKFNSKVDIYEVQAVLAAYVMK